MPSITKARFDALVHIETQLKAEGPKLVATFNHVLSVGEQLKVDLACCAADRQALDAQLKAALVPSTTSEVEEVTDKRTLMLVAKRCAANGMRVVLRGSALFNAASGDVIAQVRS